MVDRVGAMLVWMMSGLAWGQSLAEEPPVVVEPCPSASESPCPAASDDVPSALPNGPLGPPEVTLEHAGRGRKRALRVTTAANDRWEAQLKTRLTHTTVIDAGSQPLSNDTSLDAEFLLQVEGEDRLVASPTYVELYEDSVALMGQTMAQLEPLIGLPLELAHDARARVGIQVPAMDFELTDTGSVVLGRLVAGLQSLAVALPEARVGRGARWTTRQQLRQNGLVVTQQLQVRLVGWQGQQVVLEIDGGFSMDEPIAHEGAQIRTLVGVHEGTVWLSLTRPLPAAAELVLTTSVDATWDDEGTLREAAIEEKTRLTWVTRDSADGGVDQAD